MIYSLGQFLLQTNTQQMVKGFQELLGSGILEPLIRLEQLLIDLGDEIELVAFACNM